MGSASLLNSSDPGNINIPLFLGFYSSLFFVPQSCNFALVFDFAGILNLFSAFGLCCIVLI